MMLSRFSLGFVLVSSTFALACGPSRPDVRTSPTSIVPVIGPGGEPTTIEDLGLMPDKACGDGPIVKATPSDCRRLTGSAQSSGGDTDPTVAAFDGDVCSIWAAGGPPPRAVSVDFGKKEMVSALVLIPEMDAKTKVRHVVEGSDDGMTWHSLYVVEAEMESGHAYSVKIAQPFSARAVRISTTAGAKWIAWREVAPLACK